ncbi:LysE family translocator [Ectobacillus sp. JY-23]|uniref:LysE family translocator n=1 Tax=Ectobacillus sp. JY-23 TaxID=2933872 RepID=UPI001FF10C92|nr:LysE family transporter [Ectobacillus sp. JY-23]UOY93346.1 LysE family translocator [Ectobacillus sp. JY-23]
MDLYIWKGLVIGLSLAAPVGPIGLLCIRRTLTQGRINGFVSGLGAASADAVYGMIAAFGLTFITEFLLGQKTWLQLVGGAFLCYLGIKTILSKVAHTPANAQGKQLLSAYSSVFFLTLTNPMTILSFIGIFAGLGVAAGDTTSSLTLVIGIFLGSALWWLFLATIAGVFKERMNTQALTWVNRVSGVILIIVGSIALFV